MEQLQSHIWGRASYIWGNVQISPYMRRPLDIYDFATAPFWISLYMRKIFFFFLSVWQHCSPPPLSANEKHFPLLGWSIFKKSQQMCQEKSSFHLVSANLSFPIQQISLDLCFPEKELAKTRSQISFRYFQSHSWYSVRNY